jgi:hypothetical protein
MENGGGANNASTSPDRTNYYSWGPSSLLPTLLWLDADRMEGLGAAMTKEKVDLQCSVVRNERRQVLATDPESSRKSSRRGVAEGQRTITPSAAAGPGVRHVPRCRKVATYYVPGNASLVVAELRRH